uniref:Small ribosomal subunit protein mS31 n=2 Tax=Parascaris univalens TaxID=6257 RepID=A0A915AQE1_PARUN
MMARVGCRSFRLYNTQWPFMRRSVERCRRFLSASSSSDSSSSGNSEKSTASEETSTKPLLKKGDNEKRVKSPKSVDIIGEKLLEAVETVAADLHNDDAEARKSTKTDLIAKLSEHEKETFHAATDSQTEEMLSDEHIINLLSDVSKQKAVPASRAAEVRHARRGLLLLRREIFYQAKQSGYSATDARAIAERAVAAAEARSIAQHAEKNAERVAEIERQVAAEQTANEKEQKLYEYAFRMADKMLYPESYRVLAPGGQMQMIIHPDQKVKNIFSMDEPRLDIFSESNIPKLKEHSLEVWANWDAHAARVWNQSFGPTNGFEEMIDLTEKGKMWPYPIDNEYLLGDEENVGFHEHIFLERTLSQYKLPKTGPIAHFMELVCVGLSKNPYMTAEKKQSHIRWFANYFDEKKTAEIERLHKEEQLAAANA